MTRADFLDHLGFAPDEFQLRSFDAIDAGKSVLVAAPTGSGKTVVAEYAAAKALAEGGKAFYTTPLKALSNQKYGDLVAAHGVASVGLLTGDNTINGEAPIVVMTTEVLRNMIYAGSSTLDGLRYVVLDEVHYLQNAYRGPVWEEVIVHLPPTVDLICLSATVSNAEEVAAWIGTVRGTTETIIEESRPVELTNLYMIGDRTAERPLLVHTLVDGRPNPEVDALMRRAGRDTSMGTGPRGRRGRLFTPRRAAVVSALADEHMLPVIYFIFSRAACDDAVRQCLQDGLRLTTPDERAEIRAIAEEEVELLSDSDLRALDFSGWIQGLEAGLAAHHAGMVPPFKEAVEACFSKALVKAVFATETLALGINMPARTVVIEKLSKFTGETHESITPGEYTQLTGRAGRRGIDDVGYGVVLWSPFKPFDQVAALASTRTYELRSAFRPTYNMATNLVRRYSPQEAHHLLNLSFAQFRADAEVVRQERDLERLIHKRDREREKATCDRGDIVDYQRLQRAAERAVRSQPSSKVDVQRALGRLGPGDVVVIPGVGGGQRLAVISTAARGGGIKLGVVTPASKRLQVTARDIAAPPRAIGRIPMPQPYLPNNKTFQRAVADALGDATLRSDGLVGMAADGDRKPTKAMELAAQVAAHPVADCPDLRTHMRAARQADDLDRRVTSVKRSIQGRSESLARQFDRVLAILEAWGFVDGWKLTQSGELLVSIYNECDLLLAEAIGSGLLDDLDPPEVAAMVSTLTFETRGPGAPPSPWFPKGKLRTRFVHVEHLAQELRLAEQEAGLPQTRQPDPGFVAAAHRWASGEDLEDVITDEEMTGGDFVRNIKQLIDVLRQVGDVAPVPATAKSCRSAADRLFRGVIAASSVVGTPGAGTA
ncbi:MAG: DEAD/DEAH box helicase [Acidimicrobiales bacterium]